MFPNLAAEMARININQYDIAKCLGLSEQTSRWKLQGKSILNLSEMKKIQAVFFPKLSLDYLYAEQPKILK